jgi:hypothetical protein
MSDTDEHLKKVSEQQQFEIEVKWPSTAGVRLCFNLVGL